MREVKFMTFRTSFMQEFYKTLNLNKYINKFTSENFAFLYEFRMKLLPVNL